MKIEFDAIKRNQTLLHRGLDFADCQHAFEGVTYTFEDMRKGYGETRFITWALMDSRLGGHCLDPARRGTPNHFTEEGQ